MKKLFSVALTCVLCITAARAQETFDPESSANTTPVPKRHYINLAYATQSLKTEAYGDMPARTLKSEYGAAAEFGSSFFFNARKPVARMIRFGLDFSYLDLQYAVFDQGLTDDGGKITGHFANIGMQVGPSVTVTPIERLHAKVYVHYAPSMTAFSPNGFDFDELKYGYTGYITGGVQVSYRFITLGVEMRGGTGGFSIFDDSDDDDPDGYEEDYSTAGNAPRVKLPATRFIFGFRF